MKPNPFAGLVGHTIHRGVHRPITARAYEYVLAGNGLFKRARTAHLAATIPVVQLPIAGLPDLEPELELSAGRVPGRLLVPILADARAHAGRERMVQIRLVEGRLWRVAVPHQRTGATRIDYHLDDGEAVICDLHSHHSMRARFSATDDRDESAFQFYAVIGRIMDRPEISLRLGLYGDFFPLPVSALFTHAGPFADTYEEITL